MAGIAVAALVVPKNLGYADIARVPLQNGLYEAAAGGIIYALFCTSRHISTGPSSSLAAVAGAAVLGAGVGVLSAGVLAGVVIGVVLSLGWLVYVATRPPMPLLGREPGTQVFRDLVENTDDETIAGIAVVRLDGGLFFATAEALEDRVRELTDDGSRAVVLDLEGVNFVDSQGSAKVAEIHELTRAIDVTLRLARMKPQVRSVLVADGVIELVGADHVHGNVHRAVEAELAAGRAAPGAASID